MTTCVYCRKNIDEYGDYKEYDCLKTKNKENWEEICDRCNFYIEDGREVPYTL